MTTTITNVEQLNEAFAAADYEAQPLTYRDRAGRDWITWGDEDGFRWGWSVPEEDDPFTVPVRLDDLVEHPLMRMPLVVFDRPSSADNHSQETPS